MKPIFCGFKKAANTLIEKKGSTDNRKLSVRSLHNSQHGVVSRIVGLALADGSGRRALDLYFRTVVHGTGEFCLSSKEKFWTDQKN